MSGASGCAKPHKNAATPLDIARAELRQGKIFAAVNGVNSNRFFIRPIPYA